MVVLRHRVGGEAPLVIGATNARVCGLLPERSSSMTLRPLRLSIGDHGVGVPSHFYKAILAESPAGARATFGFLMANVPEAPADEPRDFLVNRDSLAVLTDLDFSNLLPDSQETELEALAVTWWPIRPERSLRCAASLLGVAATHLHLQSRPFRNAERRRWGR